MSETASRLSAALAGRYAIERQIGQGGMATVYLAKDLKHERDVAVKVLLPELAASMGHERFLREITTTANLRHPHILPLYDSGDAGGFLFYVMPYVEGETLRHRMRRERQLPLDGALQIAREVADALSYANSRGVIHRDIKPENILLDSGHAVVADFGIAKAVTAAGGTHLTETGLSIGTPEYMSPEQASGEGDLDGRCDQYALGCMLYEMLAGEPPFTGSSVHAVIAKHAMQPRPSIRIVRDTVPQGLEAAITKAMSKLPTDRFVDAAAFREALALTEGTTIPTAVPKRLPVRVVWSLVAVAMAVIAVGLGWHVLVPRVPLDPNRIMVFPLVVSEGFAGSPSAGEDVATLIGNALDGAGPLRWIDGWTHLDPARRESIRDLSDAEARAVAGAQRCGYYVTGRVVDQGGGSAQISLVLHAVRNGSEVKRSTTTAPIEAVWRGVDAVNGLLPELIPGAGSNSLADLENRPPLAISNFLLGEAAFRRIHLDEAVAGYRAAVATDSAFALAALRGAQAASWAHRNDEAAAMIDLALRQPLAPRYAAFARGYRAYLAGQADSAIAALREALAIDDEMAVAWLQLGETWTHLLPEAGSPDDSALAAFDEVIRLDSSAVNPMYHPIEILARRGDTQRMAPLVRRFLEAEPDGRYADNVRIMYACVQLGADRVSWDSLANAAPLELMLAAFHLSGGGGQIRCAEAAYSALILSDTAATPESDNRRFWEIFGLQNVLLAQGREQMALARADSFVSRWHFGTSMFLLAAPLYPGLAERAGQVAAADSIAYGADYAGLEFPIRLWELGRFEASRGNLRVAEAVAATLRDRAADMDAYRGRMFSLSLSAHTALARGDTTRAMQLLDALVPATVPGDRLTYDEVLPGAADRLAFARLLLARGEYRRAIDVANVLDSSWPVVHTLYLRPGLELRIEAAEALGDERLAQQLRGRLEALRYE